MNDVQNQYGNINNHPSEDNTGVIGMLIVLAKRKKRIVFVPLAAAAVSLAVSLLLPNVYQATTKLLPPQQAQSGAAALLSQLGGASGLASGLTGMKNPSDLYMGMLKSRTVADRLIASFDLKKVYDVKLMVQARLKLENNTLIASGKDGLITIEVEDTDPKRVAALTNAYVSELERLTTTLAITEAAQRRLFFQKELELAKNNLATAEIALKSGLDSNGVISVDIESRAIVETVERLRAQISAKEIEFNSQRAFLTDDNPTQQRTQEQLTSLRNQLSKLENGRNPGLDKNGHAAENQSGLKNIKLLRDVKYFQMLYELLAKQFEGARLDEAKYPSVIQVLDKAIEPERKFKPKRALIVILSTLFGLLCAIAWTFIEEAKRRMLLLADTATRWDALKSHLRLRGTR
jgi:tyrosine-protein kinase Etk/Wzc